MDWAQFYNYWAVFETQKSKHNFKFDWFMKNKKWNLKQ